ncbi:MAG TPA: OsmC family protein [Marmoricola sp.]|nr:OsmC family protein [Marmoricola sp.]
MQHRYALEVTWAGNRGSGTSGYRDYDRSVTAVGVDKPLLELSADPTFRGEASKWNPEELLLAALSQCHLLSYLHVAVMHGLVVTGYVDEPVGHMVTEGIGGHFTSVVLRPTVTIADQAQAELSRELHHEASQACFIASSVNFPVTHEPEVRW